MIIEFVSPKDDKPAILVHIELGVDMPRYVELLCKELKSSYPNHSIFKIPNGKPCPNNPLPKMMVVRKSNEALLSGLKKLCKETRPGSVTLFNDGEMDAINKAKKDGDLIYL